MKKKLYYIAPVIKMAKSTDPLCFTINASGPEVDNDDALGKESLYDEECEDVTTTLWD